MRPRPMIESGSWLARSRAMERAEDERRREERRRALVNQYAGDDPERRAWLDAMCYAEIVARHNAGDLSQPPLPGFPRET